MRKAGDDPVLRQVRVLVFVDKHVAEAIVELVPDLRVLGQNLHDVQQQVVKIDRVGFPQATLIFGIDLRDDRIEQVADPLLAGLAECLGRQQVVLRAADSLRNSLGGEGDGVVLQLLDDPADDPALVIVVEDGEIRSAVRPRSARARKRRAQKR